MAYQLVQEVLDHAPPMTAAERLVLVAIAEEIRSTVARKCELDTESLCRRTGGLDPSKVRAALRRLKDREIEVRIALGTDRAGNPVYAYRGQVPRYQLPVFPPPPGCGCGDCRFQDEPAVDSAVDDVQEGGRDSPPSDETRGQEGGRVRPPTQEGGRSTTEGGRSTTQGGRKTTESVAQRPPSPSVTETVIPQQPPTIAHLITRTGATDDESQLLIQTIKTRYRPRNLGGYIRAMSDADLTELLDEIRVDRKPVDNLPPKCDRCGPNRQIELDGRIRRCPTCHPLALAAARSA
ncbi:hypothetical protein [Micromonospora sp. HUAS LYJ1]|uniref:hypothetical protein n=1 Tax=Micromonospora sp. HUAS LYJ1 TaxID=3061626 RepID=UPI002672E216|nr:hypothetical protein [Micromonospora sp. HUAS LYJ1]WKU03731.1 hypothetical protein Q2K16_23245 [Micromonospora sp. HUAS LYJ1]